MNDADVSAGGGVVKIDLENYLEKDEGVLKEDFQKLESVVNGKASEGHKHGIGDIKNLQETLIQKSETGHKHSVGDVSGLEERLTALDTSSNEHAAINERIDANSEIINNLSFVEQNKYLHKHYCLSYWKHFASTQVRVNDTISEEHIGKRIALAYNIYFNDTNTITNDSNIIGDITWIWEKDGQEVATAVCRKHSKSGWWGDLGTFQYPQCITTVTEAMVGCPAKPNKYRFVVIPQSQTIKDTLPNFASHISEHVNELKTDLTTIQSDISELITTNSSEHETINNTLTANETRLAAAEDSITQNNKDIADAITKAENAEKKLNEIKKFTADIPTLPDFLEIRTTSGGAAHYLEVQQNFDSLYRFCRDIQQFLKDINYAVR